MVEREQETVLKTVFKEESTVTTEEPPVKSEGIESEGIESESVEAVDSEDTEVEEEEVNEYTLGKFILEHKSLFLPFSEKEGYMEHILKRMCKQGFIQRKKAVDGTFYVPTGKLYLCFPPK